MRRLLLALLLCLLVFAGCDMTPSVQYNGRELSDEELAAMLLVTELEIETEPPREAQPWDTSREVPMPERVYWTKGGSVWHLTESCPYLSADADRYYGDEADATEAGKDRPCSSCEKKYRN